MLKSSHVLSEAQTVLDSRASLVRMLTHTIVKMVLVAEDAAIRKTVTEKVTGAKKLLVLFPLKKTKKKPSLRENLANLVNLVNHVSQRLKNLNQNQLSKKKSASPWICIWLKNKPRAKASTKNTNSALLSNWTRKTSRLTILPRLNKQEVLHQLSKLTKPTLSELAPVLNFWDSTLPLMLMKSPEVAEVVAAVATDLATTDPTPLSSRKVAVRAAS